MRYAFLAVALASFCGLARAENLNLNAQPETTTVGLSPYALGLGVGVLMPVNEELMDRDPAFLKLSIAQSLRFHEHIELGMDLDWWLPGTNLGGSVNIDYVLGKGAFRPFIGAGVGLQYVDHPSYKFGDNFGAQGTAHVGMLFDVLDELQLRIRVPFHFVANLDMDRAAGLDIALLFSSPQRTTRVRKLKY
jgi:hypothetical protein